MKTSMESAARDAATRSIQLLNTLDCPKALHACIVSQPIYLYREIKGERFPVRSLQGEESRVWIFEISSRSRDSPESLDKYAKNAAIYASVARDCDHSQYSLTAASRTANKHMLEYIQVFRAIEKLQL
jgi:hypothetical protein